MLNTAERTILQNRVVKLNTQKGYWLKLKKNERGNHVKEIDKKLATLKRWLNQ